MNSGKRSRGPAHGRIARITVRVLLVLTPTLWAAVAVADRLAFQRRDDAPNWSSGHDGTSGSYVEPIWGREDMLTWIPIVTMVFAALCLAGIFAVGRRPAWLLIAVSVLAVPYLGHLLLLWPQNPLLVQRIYTDVGTIEQDPGFVWYLPTRHALFAVLAAGFVALVVFVVAARRAERRRSRLSPDEG